MGSGFRTTLFLVLTFLVVYVLSELTRDAHPLGLMALTVAVSFLAGYMTRETER